MKIHTINHKNISQPQISYDIVEENIETLSSPRLVLSLDISDKDMTYNIKGDYSKKWRLNSYGAPALLSKINSKNSISLDYFTISSNICDIGDSDGIEYSGLQLGEIENSHFAKLLCYNSHITANWSVPGNPNGVIRIFNEIDLQIQDMLRDGLCPQFIVCDSFSILKLFALHPTFSAASNKPYMGDVVFNKEPIQIILNNLMGNDIYSNICLCADLIGPMHLKGGVQNWQDQDNIIFTETIGMAILEEKGIKRFILEK